MRHCKKWCAWSEGTFSVNKVKKGKAEGRLLEVIEKAPQEIEPVPVRISDSAAVALIRICRMKNR